MIQTLNIRKCIRSYLLNGQMPRLINITLKLECCFDTLIYITCVFGFLFLTFNISYIHSKLYATFIFIFEDFSTLLYVQLKFRAQIRLIRLIENLDKISFDTAQHLKAPFRVG